MKSLNGSNTDLQGANGEQVSVEVDSQGTVFQTSYSLMDVRGNIIQKGAFTAGGAVNFALQVMSSPMLLAIVGVFTGQGSWYDIELTSPQTAVPIHYRNGKPQ